MPIDNKKRLETHAHPSVWIEKDLYTSFKKIHPNLQGWLIEKMKEEVTKSKPTGD